MLVDQIYLNMKTNVMMIVHQVLLNQLILKIFALQVFQKIIILMVIYIKNVMINAKNVVNQEMKQIIIAMHVLPIINFLMIL